MRRPFALWLVLVVAFAACGGGEGATTSLPPPAPVPSMLTGVIVEIDGSGNDITSFVLDAGGQTYDIRIAPGVDYGFDLSHLELHRADSLPVLCTLETRGGELYALRIDDA